eukprot:gene6019-8289_t
MTGRTQFAYAIDHVQQNFHNNSNRNWSVCSSNSTKVFPQTVSTLSLKSYLGLWYQAYASLIPNITFEAYGSCVFANYSNPITSSDFVKFDIKNSERVNGTLKETSGFVINTNPVDEPGKYCLTLKKSGYYWIVKVGDIDATTGLYPWAIVSGPFETVLFILVRNIAEFESDYETTVLKIAKDLGFNKFYNKPIKTYQGSDCIY